MPGPATAPDALAFLLLQAGEFEFLLPLEEVLQVAELSPDQVSRAGSRRAPHELGEVELPDGRTLALWSLAALAADTGRAQLPAREFEAVEVRLRTGPVLLLPERLGSIEEYSENEGLSAPALLWGRNAPLFPRSWPGVASLRWEIAPALLEP